MPSRRRFLETSAGAAAAALTAPAFTSFAHAAPNLRITSVEAHPVDVWGRSDQGKLPAFDGPDDIRRWRYSGPYAQLASAMMVVVKTNEGVVGYGMGAGGAAGAQIIDGHLKNLLLGMNPLDVERLWDQMYTSSAMYGRRGVFVMALSGVDNALWDLTGKVMGQPVYRLLGGRTKEKAEVYMTNSDPQFALDLGVQNLKLPIRDGVYEGEAGAARTHKILRDAREAIGPTRRLMIDCGLRWNDVPYSKGMARRLEDVDLYFIEEPLSPDNVLGYAELVREVEGTRIASGEHEYTQYGFEMLFHHNAVEVVQPDVTWCGGITACRKVAAMSHARGLTFIPHRGGSLYGLPLVLSSTNCPMAESFGTGDSASDLMLAVSARFKDGYYYPPEKPGFGTEVTEALIKKHRRT